MPRALVLAEFPTLGGGEHSFLAAAPHLQAAGFELTFAAPGGGPLERAVRGAGLGFRSFPGPDLLARRAPLDERRAGLEEMLRAERPDLLVANSLSMGRLSGPVCVGQRLPSVAHLRDIVRLSARAVADLNQQRRLLAVSVAVRTYHVQQGLDPARLVTAYNGVDRARFCPRPATGGWARRLGIPPTAPLVATIGQIILRKGWDILAAAIVELAPHWPDVHWLFVGRRHSEKAETRAYEAGVRATLAPHSARGRVFFVDEVADVAGLFPELTLYVHPARQEPLGRVLLEAAACGVPVVATDVGGTHEIFGHDSRAATLVPPHDPSALAAAIDGRLWQLAAPKNRGDTPSHPVIAEPAESTPRFDVRHTAAKWIECYRAALREMPV